MTTFYSCCRQGLSILLLALLAPVLQADAPSVSYIFPAGGQRSTWGAIISTNSVDSRCSGRV